MVLSQSRCRPLGLAHRVRVDPIVAGDDQRIDFGERKFAKSSMCMLNVAARTSRD
jgi:hypothetical protein